MSQTHALTYWTEAQRGTDAEHRALEAVVRKFETELDELFFGWLVDFRAYVMHERLVFRCEVRARGRTAVVEESVSVELMMYLGGLSVTAAHAERERAGLPLRCMYRLAETVTKECQS